MLPLIRLPRGFQENLSAVAFPPANPRESRDSTYAMPVGEAALVPADSVSWRIFKNPIALLIGGVAAVILELAEPAVRTGVWQQSSFRSDPMGRLRRTGSAALLTIYGARSIAEPMIARVARLHSKVSGRTPDGVAFSADDPELLTWVHSTATYAFAEAYHRYVHPLQREDFDAFCLEAVPVSLLYGALGAPRNRAEIEGLFASMHERLEASAVIFEFLRIMHSLEGFPAHLKWMQHLAVRAAVDIIPSATRQRLGLTAHYGLRGTDRLLIRLAATVADKILLPMSPATQSCVRLGLPMTFLYR